MLSIEILFHEQDTVISKLNKIRHKRLVETKMQKSCTEFLKFVFLERAKSKSREDYLDPPTVRGVRLLLDIK